ncbi:MAG: phosphoglycerate mutase family protein [Kofleriaceae bacterium]
MPLYLVRHAEAVDERRDLPDPARYLSGAGRSHARTMGDRLRWHDCAPVALWTSPLTRAVQTAELLAAALRYPGEIVADPALAPEADVRRLAQRLRAQPAAEALLVVGHEPDLSALLGLVVDDDDVPQLAKAEVVRVDGGVIRWRFGPDDDAPRR